MNDALLIANEDDLPAAIALLGDYYECFVIGQHPELTNRGVVIWPNGEDMTAFAQNVANLPRSDAQCVKLLKGDKRPADFTTRDELIQWAKSNQITINGATQAGNLPPETAPRATPLRSAAPDVAPPLSEVAPQINLEQRDKQAHHSSDDSTQPVAAEYSEKPRTEQNSDPEAEAGMPIWGNEPPLEAPASDPTFDDRPSVFVLDHDKQWPDPVDLMGGLYQGAPFQLKWAPAALQDSIGDTSNRMGTDPGIAAFAALAACAGMANDYTTLQVMQNDPTWRVRACIWPIVVGGPSTGKSPSLMAYMSMVQDLDGELALENIEKMKDYNYKMKQYAKLEAEHIKEGLGRPEEPEHPTIEQVWLENSTFEGARDALLYSRRGVIWYKDEISGLIADFSRYSGGKSNGDRQRFLKLFDGGMDKHTLAGNKQVLVQNWSAVVLGGIQPTAVIKYMGELEDDGLLQRTLICMAANKRPGKDVAPNYAAQDAYKAILRTLRQAHGSLTIKMSKGATAVYRAFVEDIALRIKWEDNASLAYHLGKWEGYAPRLMLLYHLINRAAEGQQPTFNDLIDRETAEQVCSFFLDWQLSHISEFWNELMGGKNEGSLVNVFARYILAHPDLQEINYNENLYAPHFRRVRKSKDKKPFEAREAVNMLLNAGWLIQKGTKRTVDGIPSSFFRNPKIDSYYAAEAEEEKAFRRMKRSEIQKIYDDAKARKAAADA